PCRWFGALQCLLARAYAVDERLDREPVARIPVVALLERLADLVVSRQSTAPGDEIVRDDPAHGDAPSPADVGDEIRRTVQHGCRVGIGPVASRLARETGK